MESNSSIPTELVGKWGFYVNKNPQDLFKINADGSGYFYLISHEVKWSVSENRLNFRILNINCPDTGSAQYSIINGKLIFSEPSEDDIGKDVFIKMMYPIHPDGLDKVGMN